MIERNTNAVFKLLEKIVPKKYYFDLRYWIDKIFKTKGMDSKEMLHHFWSTNPINNEPENYLDEKNNRGSQIIVETISKYVDSSSKILELGTNVGRNLNFLSKADFKQLSGVEINKNAVALMKKQFPDMVSHTTIYNEPLETFLKRDNMQFDVIYTSAVLEHIHYDSEWIFEKIPNFLNKYLVTLEIEDSTVDFHRIVGRKYKEIFEKYGLSCIEEREFPDIPYLSNYTLRVFKKGDKSS